MERRRTRRDRCVVPPLCSLLSLRDNYLSGALPSNVSALWPPSWFDDNCFSGAADVRRRAACAPTPDSATRALRDLFNSTGGARWRAQSNWLAGDPCIDGWYGVGCEQPVGSNTSVVRYVDALCSSRCLVYVGGM